ncbi:putative Zn-dependent protease [Parabacteroides sp. PF5-5]|uniref:M48 family metallopeptidase n=1 Tax=unclassified Parabacteroides TaxID=2649774 RepID=UPI0024741367|nr:MULTISPECIES: M48 family metallopeptidase [unclassified Parabacteroides]MDH6304254.1 putative Zn-dependent protease [Parabacteroides sp. PH5-39]MDH6315031.1 putative Zn-dependent protease [Parabacteroides sp. PF5-13]MDH6318691.1 putative Zn-dependent protease [Parabacteroides sp. PH5-13]MDH6322421.1 putative Zn-dependent protease [Parabacteroides sp. PH5-8]MDH6326444.1 putative Zn-dependent protease [Parabacteroides sp. PH5-41]
MKKLVGLFIVSLLILSSCGSVPLTGRKQMLLVSDQEVLTSSLTQYGSFMKEAKVSTNQTQVAQIVRVGKKIAAATEAYLKASGLESEIQNFSWEFNLVQSKDVNAFCMPGGKIVFYEGIMPYFSSDAEVAAVMGHEVAHAVAKHSNERMSTQLMSEYGAAILGQAVSGKSAAVQTLASTVYGLGSQYGVMLPYSRKHEYEADHMGLIFMAIAGYNPEAAVTFWTKMAQGGTASVPEIMSTHPSDANRIAELQKYLPDALRYYKK